MFLEWAIHTCRKNRGFSPSGVREWILGKLKYGTNNRFLLQRHRIAHRQEETILDPYRQV